MKGAEMLFLLVLDLPLWYQLFPGLSFPVHSPPARWHIPSCRLQRHRVPLPPLFPRRGRVGFCHFCKVLVGDFSCLLGPNGYSARKTHLSERPSPSPAAQRGKGELSQSCWWGWGAHVDAWGSCPEQGDPL